MLGCVCGVSRYPQFYHQDEDKYQVFPHTYLGYFEGYPGETFMKEKCILDLAGQAEIFFWGFIEKV